jgi:long-chain fatty acid transport protein
VFAVAGFGLDYAGSTTNPVLTAAPPHGIGVGPIYTNYQVVQVTPAIAYQLTNRLSVSVAPSLDVGTLQLDPALFAAPDNANGDGFATYPTGAHAQTTYGAGFTAGAFYQADGWAAGASVKSPQWFETYHFNSMDQLGQPRQLSFGLDLPMIVSAGLAYTGLERWVFATDVRYIDYRDARGFGDSGFSADGALRGIGWRSIATVAVGAQFQLTDAVSLRAGYSWNQNPIPEGQSAVNVASPIVIENMVTVGASWNLTPDFKLSIAYLHAFENSIDGPLFTATGAVPGGTVRNSASADAIVIGGSVKFGSPRHAPVYSADGETAALTDSSNTKNSQ